MPNGYAGDIDNIKLGEDTLLGPVAQANREEIERLAWRAAKHALGSTLINGPWTIYDDGNTKTLMSTLSQVGRTVAKLLSLNELPDDENDQSLTLSAFLNKGVYVKSFVVSQNDIFESVTRVTGTTEADWMVTHEATKKRYEDGLAHVKIGNMAGFSKMLYARAFFPDDPSELSAKAQNEILRLPDESLDEFTKLGIDMVKELQGRVERMTA